MTSLPTEGKSNNYVFGKSIGLMPVTWVDATIFGVARPTGGAENRLVHGPFILSKAMEPHPGSRLSRTAGSRLSGALFPDALHAMFPATRFSDIIAAE
jgi:hypothetical protein